MSKKKIPSKKIKFKIGDFVVYPTHGVGKVKAVVREIVAGFDVELYVISFDQEKMTLSVPTNKAVMTGLRALSNTNVLKDAFTTLKGRPRIKRTMWSRRAQEYEAKINSGDLILVTEVVRDLYRMDTQPEQSYSERQLYESALDRMVREVAAIEQISRDVALDKVLLTLNKTRIEQQGKTVDMMAETVQIDAQHNQNDNDEETSAA